MKQLSAVLSLCINGGKLNGNAYAGQDAVVWVLLHIANGSVNWCDASSFFPSLKCSYPLNQ